MAQTNINIRIDEQLKKQFDKLCEELGFSMTSAFNMFAKTAVRLQKIPFELSLHTPNEETLKAIDEVNKGIGLVGPFSDTKELMKSLLEDEE